MTHVCRLWRSVLFSTPSLRILIDFSVSAKPQQAEASIHRSGLAPESKYFEIQNRGTTEPDTELPNIFGGRMPKLTSLSLRWFRANFRDLDLPHAVQLCDGSKHFHSGCNVLCSNSSNFAFNRFKRPLLYPIYGSVSPPCENSDATMQPAPPASLITSSSQGARR